MAKHPHKLILQDKKTWRCALQGCSFFVHLGLAHILLGKTCVCWNCNEQYIVSPFALKDEMPVCDDCRSGRTGQLTMQEKEDIIEAKLALARAGVSRIEDMSPAQRKNIEILGIVKPSALAKIQEVEEDVIEDEYAHTSECAVFEGGECTCR